MRPKWGLLMRPVRQRELLLELLILVAAYAAATWWLPSGSPARPMAESIAVLTATSAAILWFLRAAPNLPVGTRQAWSLLGLGQLAAFGVCFLLEYVQALLPVLGWLGTLSGILRLLAYVMAGSSLFLFPSLARHDPTRFRFILDAVISCGVVMALIFLVLDRPLSLHHASFEWVLPVAFASADAILLVVLSNSALARLLPGGLSIFLGLAWTALLASDYARASLVLIGGYAHGNLLSLGWIVAPLLVASGAVHERDRALGPEKPQRGRLSGEMGVQFQRVMPIALEIVLVWYVLADWRLRGELSTPALWMSTVLGAVLIARLGIRAGEAQLDQYWRLFENLPDPSFIVNSRGEVHLGNPAGERMAEAADLHDRHRFLTEIFDGISAASLAEAANSGRALDATQRHTGRPFVLTLSPLAGDYRGTQYAAVAHDLTEQKRQKDAIRTAYDELRRVHGKLEEMNSQLEQRVQERTRSLQAAYQQLEDQNRALQRLDQAKTDFVNLVSHELRAPLTNVTGGVELMLKRRRGNGESSVLRLIQAEIRRLASFVENILSVAAIEAGRLALHPEPLDLRSVVAESVTAWKTLPERRRIHMHSSEDLPLVLADRVALRSVLSHLIDNSLKYAPDSPVHVIVAAVDGAVRLEVRDAGPGVPPEKQHLLFQRFERLNASDSQAVYGHGLGLYLSQRLLSAMGSELCFDSPPGGGARFSFSLGTAE